VHRDEILQQTSAKLRDFGVRHGIIAAGYDESDHNVQVASVMSLARRLDRWREWAPTLIVIDEAHHAAADTWKRILAAFPDADLLGLTATPRRLDGKPLDEFFDELIVGPPIGDLIDGGYLSAVTVFTPPRQPNLSKVKIRAGDYAVDQLSQVMSGGMIINGAVEEYQRLCAGAPAIAFCVDIAHSKLVANAFRRRKWRAEHVDGDTPRQERRDLIAALDNGEIDVLTNCALISEGLDVPGVEAAILLRPTRSLALYLQMVGRALRPGKDLAYVLDHSGNVYRHGLPTARRRWTLRERQKADGAAKGLIRCPHCGAMNERGATKCEHCGEPLGGRQQRQRVVAPGQRLAEAVQAPISDADLAAMSARDRFKWAAGPDGKLIRERLERIARAKGYEPFWVRCQIGSTWEQAYERMLQWRERQLEAM
jgi:DNA repair protein RadD